MPGTPSDLLGLEAPLSSENADGPALAQLLIDGLEAAVGMAKIDHQVPSSGVITLGGPSNPFSQNFKHLRSIGSFQTASGSPEVPKMQFNNDTGGSNYGWQGNAVDRSNAVPFGDAADPAIFLPAMPSSGTTRLDFDLLIPFYSQGTYKKTVQGTAHMVVSGAPTLYNIGGIWSGVAAITEIDFFSTAGLRATSEATLYGIL
jgi:hypothetical protein